MLRHRACATSPSDDVELTFEAEANQPYRLWLRLLEGDYWGNDSSHLQSCLAR